MAGLHLERDRRGRDIRGAVSTHGRGQVGDFGGRRDRAALVPSRELVVLSRRVGGPRGGGGTHEPDILAWPLRRALPGRGILVPALCPAVCSGPRRPALLDDSAAADRSTRQADRCGELVRGAQDEVAEMIQSPPHDLRRVIGLAGGTALIVGITIGSGIFRTPPTIAGLVPNPLVIMGLWTAFGLISICGALAVAELSTLLPRAGGVYVFLREAYGDAAAFVFGWLYVLITTPTTVAALAVVFAEFLLNLLGVPTDARAVQLIAIAAIITLTFANVLGAQVGAAVSGVTTLVKVTALAAIILGAFLLGHGSLSHLTEGGGGGVQGGGLARAVAAVIWTYDGWIGVSMIAGEVVAPERLMKRIIIVGMLVIVTLYIGANLAYLYIMPVSIMAQQKEAIARTVMTAIAGPAG